VLSHQLDSRFDIQPRSIIDAANAGSTTTTTASHCAKHVEVVLCFLFQFFDSAAKQ